MNLADVFSAVAYKTLVPVDLPMKGSNQHEINTTREMRRFFGSEERQSVPARWTYFRDDQDPLSEAGNITFYDARARSVARTGRREFRLYYQGRFLEYANVGDTLVLARTKGGGIQILVFQSGSAWLRAFTKLLWSRILYRAPQIEKVKPNLREAAFVNEADGKPSYTVLLSDDLGRRPVAIGEKVILEELGFEPVVASTESDENLIIDKFGRHFPATVEMSEFARSQVSDLDLLDPDVALASCLEREEQLFLALERVIVQEKLDAGFQSVDDFISYSLSVQNRRKSRMGHSLQHHLSYVFTRHRLKFASQCRTENKNRPDFIFPGAEEYNDNAYDSAKLIMLGAKSTAKDRWRQILTEAARIQLKHLCTIDPAISRDQTGEMLRHGVCLVIPTAFHSAYSEDQLKQILSLTEFVRLVGEERSRLIA